MSAVRCGDGFRQGSPGCGTCQPGRYRPPFGIGCERCPDVDNVWVLLQLPLAFLGGILGLGLVVFGLLLLVRHYRGGDVSTYAKATVKYILQVFVAVQVW
jgi:hypothetical protein